MSDEWQVLLAYTAVILTLVGLFGGGCTFMLRRIERLSKNTGERVEKLSDRTRDQVKDLHAKIEKLGDQTIRREDIESRLKRIERAVNGMIPTCAPKGQP